jgi:hypothetical protein
VLNRIRNLVYNAKRLFRRMVVTTMCAITTHHSKRLLTLTSLYANIVRHCLGHSEWISEPYLKRLNELLKLSESDGPLMFPALLSSWIYEDKCLCMQILNSSTPMPQCGMKVLPVKPIDYETSIRYTKVILSHMDPCLRYDTYTKMSRDIQFLLRNLHHILDDLYHQRHKVYAL